MDPNKATLIVTTALSEYLNVGDGIVIEYKDGSKYVVYKDLDLNTNIVMMHIRSIETFSLTEEQRVHGQIVKIHDYSSN